MDYKLAKQLKDAGFPIKDLPFIEEDGSDIGYYEPTLSELVEACGDGLQTLLKNTQETKWEASEVNAFDQDWENFNGVGCMGKFPEEAVAKLWLKLNT